MKKKSLWISILSCFMMLALIFGVKISVTSADADYVSYWAQQAGGGGTLLLDADDASKLASGRDTGNASTVGTAVDATYGNVWTLNATATTTDFHAKTALDVSGYSAVEFYVYNPTSSAVPLVLYTASWESGKSIPMGADGWTKISVPTATYGGDFFCIINANASAGTWKVTSLKGVKSGPIILDASVAGNISSGRDTGNASTVGTAVDATYGNVWTLNTTAASTDFHASSMSVTGYDTVKFSVYNPTSSKVALVVYTASWDGGAITWMEPNAWANISVDTATYGATFFCIINSNASEGTWKVTSFYGKNATYQAEYEAAENAAKVAEVQAMIDELPSENELSSMYIGKIYTCVEPANAAQAAYDALDATVQVQITGVEKINAVLAAAQVEGYGLLLNAGEISNIASGRDTGNAATVGTTVDETYGNVWTLNTTATTTDFHANLSVDTTGYDYIEFYVYNPTSVNVTVVWYDSSWVNLENIVTTASGWTKVSLPTASFPSSFFVIANNASAGEWKISSFVGVDTVDPAAQALNERIAALPEAGAIQDISYVKYIFEVDSIQAAYAALTSEQQAEVENYAKVAEVEAALSIFKVAVEAAADSAISTGADANNNTATAVTATTDAYYGNVLSMTFNAGQASFRTDALDTVMGSYKAVTFYIYNPTATDDTLVWYINGWGNVTQNITMKAGAWTEVTLSMDTYTTNSFFIIDQNVGGGAWLISDIYGITKEIDLTIKDAAGNVIVSGEDAISYDTDELNKDRYVFIGFEYDGKLYRNIDELRENVDRVTYEVTAKTVLLNVIDGASVRIVGNSGLRFTADVESGYTDYGMIFTGAQLLNGEFTKENLDSQSIKYKHVYSTMDGFNSTENEDGSIRFSIVLQNIQEVNYAQMFTARAYITITYFDGTTSNVYSVYETAKHARSIQQVAIMAMADTEKTYTGSQWYTLRKYEGSVSAENKLVNADHWSTEWTVIKSGTNTGNSGTVGQTADAMFGNVFTLTMQKTGAVDNGDFFPIAGMEIGSYTYVRFYVYNPATVDIGLVAYDASWGNGATVATLKAQDWTEVNIKCATYGTNPFFIVNSSECFDKEFKITSFYGVKGSNEELVESYASTVNIDGMKVFDIMAYGGPASGIVHENRAEYNEQNIWVRYYQTATVADVKKYVDAGYEYWCADDAWYGRNYLKELADMSYAHDVYWVLDMAAEYYQRYGKELPVIVTIDRLASAMKGETGYTTEAEKTEYKAWLANAIAELKAYKPSNGGKNFFAGIQLCDEPVYAYAESYTYWYNYLATELNLVQDGYILTGAFFGLEANQDQLVGNGSSSASTTDQYKTYLNAFTDNKTSQSVLLYDNYPFQVKDSLGSDQYLICDSYFENMQIISQRAHEKDLQAGICIQSMGWKAGEGDSKYYYTESEANISMQVYAALAYGYSYLNYYVYTQPYNFTDQEIYNQAPITWDETTKTFAYTDLYTYVNNVNNEVRGFEEVLMSFDYLGTQLVTGQTTGNNFGSTTNYETDAIVATSEGAAYDMAIGYFEQNGTKAYLVANVDNPHNDRTNTATLNLGSGYTRAIVYVDGVATIQTLTNGTLGVSLARGEGVLVIPIA